MSRFSHQEVLAFDVPMSGGTAVLPWVSPPVPVTRSPRQGFAWDIGVISSPGFILAGTGAAVAPSPNPTVLLYVNGIAIAELIGEFAGGGAGTSPLFTGVENLPQSVRVFSTDQLSLAARFFNGGVALATAKLAVTSEFDLFGDLVKL